jgi:hypothetical protein
MTAHDPKDLANLFPSFKLTTGDKVPPPANPKPRGFEPLQPMAVEQWPKNRLAALALLAPVSIWLAAAAQPVAVALLAREGGHVFPQRWIGGNPNAWAERDRAGTPHNEPTGCWPIKLGLSTKHKDTITASLKNGDPYVPWALRWRIWLKGLDYSEDGNQLEQKLRQCLTDEAREAGHAQLLGGAIDAGPDFSPYRCKQRYARRLAAELDVHVWWSDDELAEFLIRAMKESVRLGIGRREAPFLAMCLKMLEEDNTKAHALQREKAEKECERKAAEHPARGYMLKGKDPEDERLLEEYRREKGLRGE